MAVYGIQDTGEFFPRFCSKCQFWGSKEKDKCDLCQIAHNNESISYYTFNSSSEIICPNIHREVGY